MPLSSLFLSISISISISRQRDPDLVRKRVTNGPDDRALPSGRQKKGCLVNPDRRENAEKDDRGGGEEDERANRRRRMPKKGGGEGEGIFSNIDDDGREWH